MVRRYWQLHPPCGFLPLYQFRNCAPADGIRWRDGDSMDELASVSDLVVLWGITSGTTRELEGNADLAQKALRLAQSLNVDRVLFCSSAAVYAPHPLPIREDSGKLKPANDYGRSKLDAESAVQHWWAGHNNGPGLSILRLANVVGADGLFASLQRGGTIYLDRFVSGLGPVRSYIAPGDLARVFERLLELSPDDIPGVLNVAGRTPIAMQDLAEQTQAEIAWRPAPQSAVPLMSLDTGRLCAITGRLGPSGDAARVIADWRRWRTRGET